MSYSSFTTYECSFPASEALPGALEATDLYVTENGDRIHVEFDDQTSYPDGVLEELVELFGRPLNEVPGLKLRLDYETYEEGYWACHLDIENGECSYKESEIKQVRKPMEDCLIELDYGTTEWARRKALADLRWAKLDENDCLKGKFWFRDRSHSRFDTIKVYPAGTPREKVERDIDEYFKQRSETQRRNESQDVRPGRPRR